MPVTRKKKSRLKKHRRTKDGPALIVDLANFLNLDLAKCDIQRHWHHFQSWPRLGIASGDVTDADLKRYAELKLLVTLLEEPDVQPGRLDLIELLKNLQEEIRAVLKPILRTPLNAPNAKEQHEVNYGIRYGMQEIVRRLNLCTFNPQWSLYAENIGDETNSLKGWYCTYDPEQRNRVTPIDDAILSQQRVLHLGDYRFVVKAIPPRSKSIADRLYWIVGQTLSDASIARLKTCVECGKYFSAYDSKQVVCGSECRERHNRKGIAWRVKQWRIGQARKSESKTHRFK